MTVSVDVSEFQVGVNDSYPHRWFSFRAFDGTYTDHKLGNNLTWAKSAKARGKIDGYTVYFVWRPGVNNIARLDELGIPRDCVIMIDLESWEGQITGNRSSELNAVADQIATRQGSRSRVWGYANRGDYGSLWPSRPAWLGLILASYGGSRPSMPNLIGWQYTNGQYTVPGLPNSSAPFGPCDHNELYLSGEATSGGGTLLGGLSMTDVQTILDHIDAKVNDLAQLIGEPTHLKTDSLRNHMLAIETAVGAVPTNAELATALGALPGQDTAKLAALLTPVIQQAVNAHPAGAPDPLTLAQAIASHLTLTAH